MRCNVDSRNLTKNGVVLMTFFVVDDMKNRELMWQWPREGQKDDFSLVKGKNLMFNRYFSLLRARLGVQVFKRSS